MEKEHFSFPLTAMLGSEEQDVFPETAWEANPHPTASFPWSFSSEVTACGQAPFLTYIQRIFMQRNGPPKPSKVLQRKHFLQIF